MAPVVLFAFNRPEHTRRTLEALSRNTLADRTDLTVFVDGKRNASDAEAIAQTLAVLQQPWAFKSVTVIQGTRNRGLARSILDGVTEVVEVSGRVIVLEDDLLTAPHFLSFMNAALEVYEDESAVWHISGFNEDLDLPHRAGDAYLQRAASSWGWGTWADRWRRCDKDPHRLATMFSASDRRVFDLDGAHPKWQEVEANLGGYIDSWAIFWYATVFQHNGLCLYPVVSYVENIGFDGTGVHCVADADRSGWALNELEHLRLPVVLREDAEVVARLQRLYRKRHFKKVTLPMFFEKLRRAPRKLCRVLWPSARWGHAGRRAVSPGT